LGGISVDFGFSFWVNHGMEWRSSVWGTRVAKPRDDRQRDLLRPALEEVIDLGHPLVGLAWETDW
jgi:IS5 family transposase